MFEPIRMPRKNNNSLVGMAAVGAFIALLLVGVFGSSAPADEIYFKSGYSVTAVIVRETETSLRFKTEMGLSTVSMEKVDFIDKASEEENQSLRKKWREKETRLQEQLEAKREAQRKFVAEQLSKGLVKYEGEWMTPEKRQEILNLQKRAREHRMRFEEEQREKSLVKFGHIWVTRNVEEELLELDEDIQKLDEELRHQTAMRDSLREAMLGIPLEEAENYGRRIEEVGESISENTKKLNKLFRKADDIEAISVRYETPEEFIEALPPEGEFR
jgi:hypothetical protein